MSRLHFIHADLWERRLFERRRRRRRGGRFSRMAKLTEDQVDTLFPKRTYKAWMNSGKDTRKNHLSGILHEEKDDLDSSTVDKSKLETPAITTVASNTTVYPVASASGTNVQAKRRTIVVDEAMEAALTSVRSKRGDELDIGESSLIPASSNANNADPKQVSDVIEMLELHFSSGSCAICLELFDDDDEVRGLICGHVFHAECLDPWLTKRRACCPMCKRDYFYNAAGTDDAENGNAASEVNDTDNENENTTTTANATTARNGTATGTNNNNNTNTNNTNDNTTNNNDEEEEENGPAFDLELVRNDPTLRAILQQLISTEERARMILADEHILQTDIEARANEDADKKYRPFFMRIWWKLMGISRQDLFSWAVVFHYHEYRESNPIPDPIAAATAARRGRNGDVTATATNQASESNATATNQASESNATATENSNDASGTATNSANATMSTEPNSANAPTTTVPSDSNRTTTAATDASIADSAHWSEVDVTDVRNGAGTTRPSR